jgi:hypothetical protein
MRRVFFMIFVGVDRGYAPAGGAELLIAQSVLLQAVQQLVVGHADGGAVAYLEMLRRNGDAALTQALNLSLKMLKVDDNAGAQHVHGLVPENAGGQQIHNEFALLVHHGVAGVVAALIADDHVVFLAQQVHHAALALVSPVGSQSRNVTSYITSIVLGLSLNRLTYASQTGIIITTFLL